MGWAIVSAAAILALFIRHRHASLDGDYQGWASASCLLMARAFHQLGALPTHLVPVQNNLPLGLMPDVYLHWPPLYPLLLSVVMHPFADPVVAGRMLALGIVLLCGAMVMLIARQLFRVRTAWLAVFLFFTARATFEGASPLLQQPLALLFALLCVFCFLRAKGSVSDTAKFATGYAVLGGVAMALSVASAWDPIFLPFGLLASAWWLGQRKAARLAAAYCVVAVLAFAAVEADYILHYPELFANQFATIAFRAGLPFHGATSVQLHTLVDRQHFADQMGVVSAYWRTLEFVDTGFSSLTLMACCVFLALWLQARRHDARDEAQASTWLIGGLLLPVLLWYALMRNYVAVHSFPLFLAAPFVAIASAVMLDKVWMRFPQRRPLQYALTWALPLILLLPLLVQWRDCLVQPDPVFAELAVVIKDNTPATAVVLTPTESLLPTWYSERHVVRGIESDALLTLATEEARREFPNAPLFFALRDADRGGFTASLAMPALARRGHSTLYRLP